MEIKNKTIVVTGGASGLGEATVRSFLEAGANVVIFDLNEDNANKIISELGSKNIKYVNIWPLKVQKWSDFDAPSA